MTKFKRFSRNIHGILLLDKPLGDSSNQALQTAKRLYVAKKAGHTGSLDPLASGLLPLCFGEATKFSQYLLDSDKTYEVVATLGIRTTTSDAEGEIVAERPIPALTLKKIDQYFDAFRGDIQQVPSMYSALKYQGEPLYKLARQGITVPREARSIHVYDLTVLALTHNTISFSLHCSKGTYVRTIVDDLGELLGCGAHVSVLRRTRVGPFCVEEAVSIETLEALKQSEQHEAMDHLLQPVETALQGLPIMALSASTAFYLQQGQPIMLPHAPSEGLVQLYLKEGGFIGVGEVTETGMIAPKRLVAF